MAGGYLCNFLDGVLVFVFLFFLVHFQEAVKGDDGTGGVQDDLPSPFAMVQDSTFHLAGNGTLPDQLIQLCFVLAQVFGHALGRAVNVSRADRFVRFLRVFDFSL